MNYADHHTLTPKQIHEWTGVPLHIIEQAMNNQELSNSRFTRQTRVATPAAVAAWVAKYNPAGAVDAPPIAAKVAPPAKKPPKPRPKIVHRELDARAKLLDRVRGRI